MYAGDLGGMSVYVDSINYRYLTKKLLTTILSEGYVLSQKKKKNNFKRGYSFKGIASFFIFKHKKYIFAENINKLFYFFNIFSAIISHIFNYNFISRNFDKIIHLLLLVESCFRKLYEITPFTFFI